MYKPQMKYKYIKCNIQFTILLLRQTIQVELRFLADWTVPGPPNIHHCRVVVVAVTFTTQEKTTSTDCIYLRCISCISCITHFNYSQQASTCQHANYYLTFFILFSNLRQISYE